MQASEEIKKLLEQTIAYIAKMVEAVRDERAAPRVLKNIKNGIYYYAYKGVRESEGSPDLTRDSTH